MRRRRTLCRRGDRAQLSKAAYLADLGAARATPREALARSDDRTLVAAKVPGLDWTAKDVLSHLIGYDQAVRAAQLRALEGWPADAGPFGADSGDLHKSAIEWIAPHEREHAAMIAKLGTG